MKARQRRKDAKFEDYLRRAAILDESTGFVSVKEGYASCHITFNWNGGAISMPYSHLVWFIKHNRWPQDGLFIDHINNIALDNRPDNLQELTRLENNGKNLGKPHKSYGSGKYSFGITVTYIKRCDRYYVTRNMPGYLFSDGKRRRKSLGGFSTLEEAESRVSEVVSEIGIHGVSHISSFPGSNRKPASIRLDLVAECMISLRREGWTIRAIADRFELPWASVRERLKDIV